MKNAKVLFFALVFSPIFAIAACPDIAGNYTCRYKSLSKAINVSQAKRNNVTIYQIDNGGEILADGQAHQTDHLHPMLDNYASNYNYTATCSSSSVKVVGTADLNSGGTGNVNGDLMKQGTDLSIGMKLTTPTRTMDITLSCTKN